MSAHRLIHVFVAIGAVSVTSSCERPVGPSDGAPFSVLLVSGGQQTGAAGVQLSQPLVVKVLKANGAPYKGQVVNFRIAAGGGSVFAGSAISDDGGLVQDLWTLGTRAGEAQRVEVRSVDQQTGVAQVHGTFTATAVPGAPARVSIVRGNNQTIAPSSVAQTDPTVQVTDVYGNVTAGASVTFTPGENSGTATPANVTTNSRGEASASWQVIFLEQFGAQLTAAIAGGASATFQAYVWSCGCWFLNTSTPVATMDFPAVASNDKLYVLGGARGNFATALMQIYDPVADVWSTRVMPTARRAHGGAAVDGVVYVMGGTNERTLLTSVEAYDAATDSWTTRAPMPAHRRFLDAVTVNGKIYAIGGVDEANNWQRVEVYDPATNTWTRKADVPLPRWEASLALANGVIYVMGGLDQNFAMTNTLQAYDPATDTWTVKAPMLTPRYLFAAAPAYGQVYVMGGFNQSFQPTSTVEIYNPETNSWRSFFTMPSVHTQFGAAMLNGYIYVVGGSNSNFVTTTKVESFLP